MELAHGSFLVVLDLVGLISLVFVFAAVISVVKDVGQVMLSVVAVDRSPAAVAV
jgi:hypothetical protein